VTDVRALITRQNVGMLNNNEGQRLFTQRTRQKEGTHPPIRALRI